MNTPSRLKTLSDPYAGTNMQYLLPSDMKRILKDCPVAYIPVGALEWHGEHLPLGVDAVIAYALLSRTAEAAGGVVLPVSHVSYGLLKYPYSLSSPRETFKRSVENILELIHKEGFKTIIVMTGHGPLDQIHIIKTVCEDLMKKDSKCRAYGLCWYELLVDSGEKTLVDHAAQIETSIMQELWPDLVDLSQLSDDPKEYFPGVYGPNPKFTATAEQGKRMCDYIVKKLTERAKRMLLGSKIDQYADLHDMTKNYWNKSPIEVKGGYRVTKDGTELELFNPCRHSQYISSIKQMKVGAQVVSINDISLENASLGEKVFIQASTLSPASGFYLRTQQNGTLCLKGIQLSGSPRLQMQYQLAGVTDSLLEATLKPDSSPYMDPDVQRRSMRPIETLI